MSKLDTNRMSQLVGPDTLATGFKFSLVTAVFPEPKIWSTHCNIHFIICCLDVLSEIYDNDFC